MDNLPIVDYEFLRKTISINHAIVVSVTNPVVVGPVFYDCLRDEEMGKKLVFDRIKSAKEDIGEHIRFHEEMRSQFNKIYQAAKKGSRELIIDASEKY